MGGLKMKMKKLIALLVMMFCLLSVPLVFAGYTGTAQYLVNGGQWWTGLAFTNATDTDTVLTVEYNPGETINYKLYAGTVTPIVAPVEGAGYAVISCPVLVDVLAIISNNEVAVGVPVVFSEVEE
jgi:hypothetical protein